MTNKFIGSLLALWENINKLHVGSFGKSNFFETDKEKN